MFVSAIGEENRNQSSSTVSSLVNVRNLGLRQQITVGKEEGSRLIPGVGERRQGEAKVPMLVGTPCLPHSLPAAFSSLSNPDSEVTLLAVFLIQLKLKHCPYISQKNL